MALPVLLRKLFKSSGYGSELNDDLISRNIFIRQWVSSYVYDAGVLVRGSNDQIYMSVVASGPGTSAGVKDPTSAGASYWVAPKIPTAGASENSNVAASTAFVKAAISSAVSSAIASTIPTGSIVYYGKSIVPSGWLVCNGAAVSRMTYATLFDVIGTTFGEGNGSSTFNVPNLIGKFPEGSTTPGTVHNAGIPNIVSYFNCQGTLDPDFVGNKSHLADDYVFTVAELGTVDDGDSLSDKFQTHIKMDLSKGNDIYGNSNTVQPPALTLVPCIRYA